MDDTATRNAWMKEFNTATAAIPSEWIFTDPSGWQGILPEHAEHPLVKHYNRACQVGYARGWL